MPARGPGGFPRRDRTASVGRLATEVRSPLGEFSPRGLAFLFQEIVGFARFRPPAP